MARIPSNPRIAVVVATHDRSMRLAALLETLAAQSLDSASYEVVVVDDGSADETATVLDRELARARIDLRVIRHDLPRGPAAARDAGWRAARASTIAFTDDDCTADPRWLETGLAAIAENPDAVVQGRTIPAPGELDRSGPFSRTIEVTDLDPGFQTCNIFYSRDVLKRIGGFDVAAFDLSPGGEDADLAWRAIKSGAAPTFEPGALVFHAVNELGPVGKLRVAARWTTPMRAYVRHPELRRAHFIKGIFWKGSHYLLFRAALALVVPRRLRWLMPWLVLPYLQELELRRRRERGAPWVLPYYALHDLVECWAVLRAAIRYRQPML